MKYKTIINNTLLNNTILIKTQILNFQPVTWDNWCQMISVQEKYWCEIFCTWTGHSQSEIDGLENMWNLQPPLRHWVIPHWARVADYGLNHLLRGDPYSAAERLRGWRWNVLNSAKNKRDFTLRWGIYTMSSFTSSVWEISTSKYRQFKGLPVPFMYR